jgi:hypothetical protein
LSILINTFVEKQPFLAITSAKPQFRHRFLSRGFDGPLFGLSASGIVRELTVNVILADSQSSGKHLPLLFSAQTEAYLARKQKGD